jgi:hypothetical protein
MMSWGMQENPQLKLLKYFAYLQLNHLYSWNGIDWQISNTQDRHP